MADKKGYSDKFIKQFYKNVIPGLVKKLTGEFKAQDAKAFETARKQKDEEKRNYVEKVKPMDDKAVNEAKQKLQLALYNLQAIKLQQSSNKYDNIDAKSKAKSEVVKEFTEAYGDVLENMGDPVLARKLIVDYARALEFNPALTEKVERVAERIEKEHAKKAAYDVSDQDIADAELDARKAKGEQFNAQANAWRHQSDAQSPVTAMAHGNALKADVFKDVSDKLEASARALTRYVPTNWERLYNIGLKILKEAMPAEKLSPYYKQMFDELSRNVNRNVSNEHAVLGKHHEGTNPYALLRDAGQRVFGEGTTEAKLVSAIAGTNFLDKDYNIVDKEAVAKLCKANGLDEQATQNFIDKFESLPQEVREQLAYEVHKADKAKENDVDTYNLTHRFLTGFNEGRSSPDKIFAGMPGSTKVETVTPELPPEKLDEFGKPASDMHTTVKQRIQNWKDNPDLYGGAFARIGDNYVYLLKGKGEFNEPILRVYNTKVSDALKGMSPAKKEKLLNEYPWQARSWDNTKPPFTTLTLMKDGKEMDLSSPEAKQFIISALSDYDNFKGASYPADRFIDLGPGRPLRALQDSLRGIDINNAKGRKLLLQKLADFGKSPLAPVLTKSTPEYQALVNAVGNIKDTNGVATALENLRKVPVGQTLDDLKKNLRLLNGFSIGEYLKTKAARKKTTPRPDHVLSMLEQARKYYGQEPILFDKSTNTFEKAQNILPGNAVGLDEDFNGVTIRNLLNSFAKPQPTSDELWSAESNARERYNNLLEKLRANVGPLLRLADFGSMPIVKSGKDNTETKTWLHTVGPEDYAAVQEAFNNGTLKKGLVHRGWDSLKGDYDEKNPVQIVTRVRSRTPNTGMVFDQSYDLLGNEVPTAAIRMARLDPEGETADKFRDAFDIFNNAAELHAGGNIREYKTVTDMAVRDWYKRHHSEKEQLEDKAKNYPLGPEWYKFLKTVAPKEFAATAGEIRGGKNYTGEADYADSIPGLSLLEKQLAETDYINKLYDKRSASTKAKYKEDIEKTNRRQDAAKANKEAEKARNAKDADTVNDIFSGGVTFKRDGKKVTKKKVKPEKPETNVGRLANSVGGPGHD